MNSITERWTGSCRRELLYRTPIWNLRHLMMVPRECEDFYNRHRPHWTLNQAAAAARWRHRPGSVPGQPARPRRRRDSRVSPGGIGFRHPQGGCGPPPQDGRNQLMPLGEGPFTVSKASDIPRATCLNDQFSRESWRTG